MTSFVCLKIIEARKLLTTQITRVRLLLRMQSNMKQSPVATKDKNSITHKIANNIKTIFML